MSITDEGDDRPASEAYFASALVDLLASMKMSQQDLADEMVKRGFRFHQTTVYKIINGKRKVALGEAAAIADILGVELDSMTYSKYEGAVSSLLKRATKLLRGIRSDTWSYLITMENLREVAGSRDDWRASTKKRLARWESGEPIFTPEHAVALGRKDYEERVPIPPPGLLDEEYVRWLLATAEDDEATS